jgi:hypothetical protein
VHIPNGGRTVEIFAEQAGDFLVDPVEEEKTGGQAEKENQKNE